jgi:hypothetical protein
MRVPGLGTWTFRDPGHRIRTFLSGAPPGSGMEKGSARTTDGRRAEGQDEFVHGR